MIRQIPMRQRIRKALVFLAFLSSHRGRHPIYFSRLEKELSRPANFLCHPFHPRPRRHNDAPRPPLRQRLGMAHIRPLRILGVPYPTSIPRDSFHSLPKIQADEEPLRA